MTGSWISTIFAVAIYSPLSLRERVRVRG